MLWFSQMAVYENNEFTPKEFLIFEAEKEEARLSREHAVTIKQLELAYLREESKINSWLRLPSQIIKLPVYIILSFGFLALSITKQKPDESFWAFINR